MRITRVLVSAAALLVLGWMPRLADACGVAYSDHDINEEQSTVEAWVYIQEIYYPGCPWAEAYVYGYFEHSYAASVSIESPTGRSAYDDDYQIMPYGGGGPPRLPPSRTLGIPASM